MRCCTISYVQIFLAIWIAQNSVVESIQLWRILQPFSPSGCVLPYQPIGGSYQLESCQEYFCDNLPGNRVSSGSSISYTCNDGYFLIGDYIATCYNNMWNALPTCIKVCPALESVSVDIICMYRGRIVSCESGIVPGVTATMACQQSHEILVGNNPADTKITCLEDGNWDHPLPSCESGCGIAMARGQPLIFNGFPAQYHGNPWHVGVYKKQPNLNFEQICGGTLISPNLVVSAAHCFWDNPRGKLDAVTNYAVAAGKIYRPYDIRSIDPHAQQSRVTEIKITEKYFDQSGHYAHDIALLRLKNPFVLSEFVRPICMIWDIVQARQQLNSVVLGKAVGWGMTQTGDFSLTLRQINLPFISYENCVAAVPDDFRKYVTPDKFCAGYLNGSSLCQGDSGGGFVFQSGGRWVLGGIVSVAPAGANNLCDNNHYTAFTDVTYFLAWIHSVYLG